MAAVTEMEFRILRGRRAKSITTTLDLKRADFKPLQRSAWNKTMEYNPGEKKVQES